MALMELHDFFCFSTINNAIFQRSLNNHVNMTAMRRGAHASAEKLYLVELFQLRDINEQATAALCEVFSHASGTAQVLHCFQLSYFEKATAIFFIQIVVELRFGHSQSTSHCRTAAGICLTHRFNY